MNEREFDALMEMARMEAWRRVSPSSNLHSGCDETCYDPTHYPPGDPLEGADDPTQMLREFLNEAEKKP